MVPQNWQSFLRDDYNKSELFRLLSHALFESFHQEEKQLVITSGESVLSKPSLENLASLSPCNHKEADTRMILH